MEVINITEEQRKELCNELARLTLQFRKDKNVECIYFAPYRGLGEIKGNVLEITIVRVISENDNFDEELDKYNSRHQEHDSVRKFGFKIFLDAADTQNYTILDLNPADSARSNDIMNSTILYDKSGIFTKIKEKITKRFKEGVSNIYYYYDNLAEVFPPLDEALDRAMDVACMERDTEAVKEFTK